MRQENTDEADTDDEEEHEEQTAVATTGSCPASHEFEWLSPGQGPEKQDEPPQVAPTEDQSVPSCQVSPARSYHRHPKVYWPRRPSDQPEIRMSPSPCQELHGCHRHLSPMRSSWCCPSPPPPPSCVHHNVLTGLELVPYAPEPVYWYQGCSCLPPTGLPPRYHESSHAWCRSSPHHEIVRRESSSPCNVHRACPGGSRRSRSTGSRKRDYSPSAMSPRYSPVPTEHQVISARNSGHEQWQVPVQTDEIDSLQKIQQLEAEKKNLILQASVLADQVEAQSDKITELERLLEQKKDQLGQLEQNLHQEMLTRSAVENNKLELMTELSNLRLRLTASERDRKDSDDRCRKLENELILLHARLSEKEAEHSAMRNKLIRNGTIVSSNEKNTELEKLRFALDSVMISNDEKDRKIDDLRSSLAKYKKLQDFVLSSHVRKDVPSKETCEQELVMSSIKDPQSEVNAIQVPRYQSPTAFNPDHLDPAGVTQSLCNSTSVRNSPTFVKSVPVFQKSSSVEDVCPAGSKISAPKHQYGTLPRPSPQQLQPLHEHLNPNKPSDDASAIGSLPSVSEMEPNMVPLTSTPRISRHTDDTQRHRSKSSGVSFGKGFFKLRSGKRSSSAPELAPQECVAIPVDNVNSTSTLPLNSHPYNKERNKGILKIFSKWKRSGSQNIEKFEGDFKRGGVRATAGPRLGWTQDIKCDPSIPFRNWNNDLVVDWLHRLGLNAYVSECKRWMCNGETLLTVSVQGLDKELNIKNPMHRKKLVLALKSVTSVPMPVDKLDYQWVVRWLDDIGLPQYKDAFADARVDGRVLHHLTVDDLLFLKVTSQLHHVSIKCGIKVLREKNFNPHSLIRRSMPDENKTCTTENIALWSNHRVMEWLRTVDLSEYAPNLRGSGVHGGLIVYEHKFNADLFATLLNIPPTKTLLRRHLATHFKSIVGSELMQQKREVAAEPPLSPSVKIKAAKKSQFALKKKRKGEMDNEEYLCPMVENETSSSPRHSDGDKLIVRRNSDPSPQEQRHIQDEEGSSTASKEISLTAGNPPYHFSSLPRNCYQRVNPDRK